MNWEGLIIKRTICGTCFVFLLFFGLIACSNEYPPKEPTTDQVISDVKVLASNILLGNTEREDGNFSLAPLIMDDLEMRFNKVAKGVDAEIIASIGNKLWKSEERKTIIVHYELNRAKKWEVRGIDVSEPVTFVIPRT